MLLASITFLLLLATVAALAPVVRATQGEVPQEELVAALVVAGLALVVAAALAGVEVGREVKGEEAAQGIPAVAMATVVGTAKAATTATMATMGKAIAATAMEGSDAK